MLRRRRRTVRPRLDEPSTAAALVPVPKYDKPDPSVRGGVPLGTLLEGARRRVMLTEQSAANRLRISPYELLAFESGMRTPSDSLIEQMAEIYDTSVDRLRSDAGIALDDPLEPTELTIGWATIELEGASDDERLRRIATTFRELRNLAEGAPVTVRDEEVVHLARAVRHVDAELIESFVEHFRVDRERATELFTRMRYHVAPQKELNPVRPSFAMGPGMPDPDDD